MIKYERIVVKWKIGNFSAPKAKKICLSDDFRFAIFARRKDGFETGVILFFAEGS
jgi:hypothetical protein